MLKMTVQAKNQIVENAPLLVMGLLMVDSLHFVFARLLLPHLPPVTSAFFVLLVATVEMGVVAGAQGRLRRPIPWQYGWFFVAVGFLVAASTTLNYTLVAYIDPGTASLLSKVSVLYGLVLGIVWLGDRLSRQQYVGAALAIIGVAVISFQPGDYFRLGSFMVLVSNFLYALHAALVKRYGGGMDFVDFFLYRLITTTGFLLLFNVTTGGITLPVGNVWLLLILVGTVDVMISRALYYLALRKLTMSMHTLVLTVSPVVAIVWSVFLFGVQPTGQQMLGGLAVLTGVVLVTYQFPMKESEI
jgi:O-acetylserine/cysteine efflux transporter